MAYEDQTYEEIMRRVLSRVPSNIDKREGSLIWDATAPMSVEHAILYAAIDFILRATFADTAPREYLIRRAAERGLAPYPATFAVLQADFNMEVPIGSRFSLGRLNYIITERLAGHDTPITVAFRVRCETAGRIGNTLFGSLIPIQYIDGLTNAELVELLIPGDDEEDTEHFRQRYFDSLSSQAFGGNIADYKTKVNALDGVGGVKVYPVWNGGGTVKLVIIASDYSAPTPELIDIVQTAIDPVQNQGHGFGIAPIGHVVTVAGVMSVSIDVAVDITYQDGWSWADVAPYAIQVVDGYFKELGTEWEDNAALIVRVSQIETRFLSLPGIVDVANTTLNGSTQNLFLGADEIPVRGDVSG